MAWKSKQNVIRGRRHTEHQRGKALTLGGHATGGHERACPWVLGKRRTMPHMNNTALISYSTSEGTGLSSNDPKVRGRWTPPEHLKLETSSQCGVSRLASAGWESRANLNYFSLDTQTQLRVTLAFKSTPQVFIHPPLCARIP